MKVLVTGTPGTGKTTNARKIAYALKLPYYNVTTIINTHPSVIEKMEKGVRVISPKLKTVLKRVLPDDFVIDTHLIEYVPDYDVLVILRCEPKELKKRLKERSYSEEKIKENLEVEILDYFTQKAETKKVVEIDTSKDSSEDNTKKIVKMIKGKKWNKGAVTWHQKKYVEMIK
ncbi:MAG: AAA family ATPase [Nanoarchaeota archaeon]|nr:AAA family ATPase [Nanoarchaeota archaeon]